MTAEVPVLRKSRRVDGWLVADCVASVISVSEVNKAGHHDSTPFGRMNTTRNRESRNGGGTQLLLEGFRVGQVVKVEPSPDPAKGRYRVTFAVNRGTTWR